MRFQFSVLFVLIGSRLIHGQHDLIISQHKLAFDNAVNYCAGRFRNLVKIENKEKNDFVCQFSVENKVQDHYYWVNVNDKDTESIWVDSDNNELPYRNWRNNQPDGGRLENCAHALNSMDGQWNDICCKSYFHAICEKKSGVEELKPDITYESTDEGMVYEAAVRFCGNKNMDLVTIDNAVTNVAVFEYAKSQGLTKFWINGNDIIQESVWVDNFQNRIPFRNFGPNEPNGAQKENCIAGGYSNSEEWDDISCDKKLSVICQPSKTKI